MTGKEFNEWFDNFAAAFPAVRDKINSQATKTLWLNVLRKRELAACLAATMAMFDGELEIPGADRGWPDWSQVPRIVSRWCADQKPVEPEWQKEVKRKQTGQGIIKDDPQMAQAYADALEILEGGGTMTDVRAMLLERFPDRGAPERTPYHEDEYHET